MVHDIMDRMASELVGRDAELEDLSSALGISRPHPTGADPRGAPSCSRATRGSARPGCSPSCATAPSTAAGRSSPATASTSPTAPCPTCPSPRSLGRVCAASCPTSSTSVAERHPALLRLLPGRRMLSQATDPESAPARPRRPVRRGRTPWLEAAAARQPLLLVVEDAPLGRPVDPRPDQLPVRPRLRGTRWPSSCSYRSDDLHRRHPLRRQVAEWARIRGVERVQLDPLDRRRRPPPGRAAPPRPAARGASAPTSSSRAEGNAFFVEELVGATWAAAAGSPRTSPTCCWSASTGSTTPPPGGPCCRRRRPPGLPRPARRGGPLSPGELDHALRDAVEGHVLVPTSDDFYAFRHALLGRGGVRRPAAGRAGARSTRRTPRRCGDGRANGTAAELARHARLAQGLRHRPRRQHRAGDEARGVGGAEEAAQHFLQALDLLARHPAARRHRSRPAAARRAGRRRAGRGRTPGPRPRGDPRAARPPAARRRRLRARSAARRPRRRPDDDRDQRGPTRRSRARRSSCVPDKPSNARAKVLAVHARMLGPRRSLRRGPRGRDDGPGLGGAPRHAAPGQRHPHHPGRPGTRGRLAPSHWSSR